MLAPNVSTASYRVVETKQCENCPATFIRDKCRCPAVFERSEHTPMPTLGINDVSNMRRSRCSCRKFCASCIKRNLMPEGNEAYAELFPTGVHMGKAVEMPHYDAREGRQGKRWRPDWRERVLGAGNIRLDDLRELVGSIDANPSMIVRALCARGFTFTIVGEAERRVGARGPLPQLYRVGLAN